MAKGWSVGSKAHKGSPTLLSYMTIRVDQSPQEMTDKLVGYIIKYVVGARIVGLIGVDTKTINNVSGDGSIRERQNVDRLVICEASLIASAKPSSEALNYMLVRRRPAYNWRPPIDRAIANEVANYISGVRSPHLEVVHVLNLIYLLSKVKTPFHTIHASGGLGSGYTQGW